MKTVILLSIALTLNACMTTSAIQSKADGDNGEDPKPAMKALYVLSIPFDIVTFPFQFIYAAYVLDKEIDG